MNITLDIDEHVAKKVRKIASDKNTTLEALVRDYLFSVAYSNVLESEAAARKEAADKLQENIDQLKRPMGPRNWKREDLYDRPYAYHKPD